MCPLSWHLNPHSPSWGIPSELLNATPVFLEATLRKRAQPNVLCAAWASMPARLEWPPATNVLRMQRNLICGPLARKCPQTLGAASWRFISRRSMMFFDMLWIFWYVCVVCASRPRQMLQPVGTEVLGAVSDSFCACGAGLFLWQGKCEARLAESRRFA